MKYLVLLVFVVFSSSILSAQIYLGKTCDIKMFSDGPIEDIDAHNTSAKPILNIKSNSIAIKITIKGFTFEKKLMEEHFNEKYMESDKYPYSTFSGKINEEIDYSKNGTHNVTVTGKLNIHNVEKERTLEGTLTVKGGEITINTKFMIALKDHDIAIPTLVAQNIAENIEVTLNSTLTEYKK